MASGAIQWEEEAVSSAIRHRIGEVEPNLEDPITHVLDFGRRCKSQDVLQWSKIENLFFNCACKEPLPYQSYSFEKPKVGPYILRARKFVALLVFMPPCNTRVAGNPHLARALSAIVTNAGTRPTSTTRHP
ncbi:hypothetical protein Fot_04940 [Forsythia ovata]|uniref:Uncharacterized protein n=1 Tax=Forsythia ovata TaxID=205694 RepID=A0ABD1WNQ6_9LAMI